MYRTSLRPSCAIEVTTPCPFVRPLLHLPAHDEEVLTGAVSENRTLVTENVRDFRPLEVALLADGGHHHGIVYTTDRQFPRGDPQTLGRLVRALDALLGDPPPIRDRSIFLR